MTQTDQALIDLIITEDVGAFEVLSDRYREQLRSHLMRLVHDADAADDVLQEVLLKLWTQAGQWDRRGAFKGWLLRVATNQALNHLRTLRRRRQQPLEPPPALDEEDDSPPSWMIDQAMLGPEVLAEQSEQRALLRGLVAQLPEDKREVIRLIHDAELETREVATALGIPEGTVRSRLHYAHRRLARAWEELATTWEGETE